MPEPIISVSGLRGIVGSSLTPEIAERYAAAFAATLPKGPVVLSQDGRPSGPMLSDAIRAALAAAGRACLDAGIAATPTTGVLVRQFSAAGGIQISASHNPPEYNGMKLFDRTGRVIPTGPGQEVLDRYRAGSSGEKSSGQLGESRTIDDSTTSHLARVADICDVERIRSRRFRVLLDSNHGAGSRLGLPLLEELGCSVIALGDSPDGQIDHPAEPTAVNLASVLPLVQTHSADIGFCQDPDADRLAVLDESGHYLGEEYTLALCVGHVLRQNPGPIVTNCSTSRMTQDLAQQYNVPFHQSKVGEANVVDAMLAHSAVFGGEGNGGPIDPRVGLVRDSFVGMALVLDAMAARQLPVGALAYELPRYAIHKTTAKLAQENISAALEKLETHFGDATSSRLDGLRLDWPDRWLLIRASNTEPIVRIIAEAQTREKAQQICAAAAEVIGS